MVEGAALRMQMVLVILGAFVAVPTAWGQEAAVRLRATITEVDGRTLSLETREGQAVTVELAPDATISAVVPADLASVQPGSYIGTAAVPTAEGGLQAQEVLVFPESMRGAGEGHYPWDLTPESTMTNANVEAVVAGVEGRRLTLTYKGGERTVLVPENVPVVTLEPGDMDLLRPGNHVFLSARKQPDGNYSAARIAVGKEGLVPPM
jgi:hypothetical protein